jgi:hypothetical protein
MTVAAKLDLALKLLDEVDATPLSLINTKLDRITDAVAAAKRELMESPECAVQQLLREQIGASA